MSKKNRFGDTSAFKATGTTVFREKVFGRNYRFSGQTSQVIKLSIKSKKNNNVIVSSKKTSFGTNKDGENFVRELHRLSDKGRTIVLSGTCPPLGYTWATPWRA